MAKEKEKKFESRLEELNPIVELRSDLSRDILKTLEHVDKQLKEMYAYLNCTYGWKHIIFSSDKSTASLDLNDFNDETEICSQIQEEVVKVNDELLKYTILALEEWRTMLIDKYNSLINYNGEDREQA